MRLSRISLQNFRNYDSAEVGTDSDLVLILGDNAAGKTNFLESIYYLSRLASFRAPDEFLVKIGQNHFRLSGKIADKELEVIVQKSPLKRQFKINNQKTKRSLWQGIQSVLFIPPDLSLFTAGPQARRRLLDEILSQKYQAYSAALVSLEHVLKQKSSFLETLLEKPEVADQLDFWNEQLADLGAVIVGFRQEFIEFLGQNMGEEVQKLTNLPSSFKLEYKHDASTKEGFLEKLALHREAEIRSGKNLIGPHRDDLTVIKDRVLNIYNSSRGELRTQILALKLLQARYLTTQKEKPLILLDDVFSELDEVRRTKLIENLSGYQIFITSTEEHHLPKVGANTLVIKVQDNKLV